MEPLEPPPPPDPISDKPSGLVSSDRLRALAERVGPSVRTASSRRWPWVLAALVFLGVTAAAFFSVLESVIHMRKEVAVPDLKGKTLEQALDALSPAGLSLAKEGVEFNDALPAGSVLRQSPPAGLKVREGKTVRVTLSSGGQVVFVPELGEKPLQEAQNQLRSAGLSLGAVSEVYSQALETGWVVEQDPPPGAVLGRGQMVDLTVSKGPPPEGLKLMPNFVNQPLSRALEWADKEAVKAEVREVISSEAVPGYILRQSPLPDATLKEPASVQFVVSKSTVSLGAPRVVRYRVPEGSEKVQVRLMLRDERGEREIYRGMQEAGGGVEAPVMVQGEATVQIFINGTLVEEKPLE
ncbi:MAG: PASTA domain-containing protein [Elusimicrobiota bacterium]